MKWLSRIFGKVVQVKNFLYDAGFADQVVLQKPVLSVGNLSVGGTGKTPVVEKLLELCLEKGLMPCVISRNYKAQSVGIHRVDGRRPQGAQFYGDEPFAIAKKFPQVPVFSGPNKAQMALLAQQQVVFDLLIVDDGFQHRSLQRNFDLVLLDACSKSDEDRLLPQGRLREDFSALRRSSLVALTKVNWATSERIHELESQIPPTCDRVEVEFHAQWMQPLPPGARVMALSGIGQPAVFERGLKEAAFEVVETLRFSDHHAYTKREAEVLLKKMQDSNCQQILTTEKDFVKLQEFPELRPVLNWTQLRLHFRSEPRRLHDFLDQCLRS